VSGNSAGTRRRCLSHVDGRGNLLRGSNVTGRGSIEQGLVGVQARVGKVLQFEGSAAVDVVPFVADQGDLVEDGRVDAQVVGDVALQVATMEDLASGLSVGIETWSTLGRARERGAGNGVVGRISVGTLGRLNDGHFGGLERRLQVVPDEFACVSFRSRLLVY